MHKSHYMTYKTFISLQGRFPSNLAGRHRPFGQVEVETICGVCFLGKAGSGLSLFVACIRSAPLRTIADFKAGKPPS
jgi:hypothetical protein